MSNWRIEATFYVEADSKEEAEEKFADWVERVMPPPKGKRGRRGILSRLRGAVGRRYS